MNTPSKFNTHMSTHVPKQFKLKMFITSARLPSVHRTPPHLPTSFFLAEPGPHQHSQRVWTTTSSSSCYKWRPPAHSMRYSRKRPTNQFSRLLESGERQCELSFHWADSLLACGQQASCQNPFSLVELAGSSVLVSSRVSASQLPQTLTLRSHLWDGAEIGAYARSCPCQIRRQFSTCNSLPRRQNSHLNSHCLRKEQHCPTCTLAQYHQNLTQPS